MLMICVSIVLAERGVARYSPFSHRLQQEAFVDVAGITSGGLEGLRFGWQARRYRLFFETATCQNSASQGNRILGYELPLLREAKGSFGFSLIL